MSEKIIGESVYLPAAFDVMGRLPTERALVRNNNNLQMAEFHQHRQALNEKLGLRGASTCARSLHLSFFFDGTNNNEDYDTKKSDPPRPSNIARLYRASLRHEDSGYFSYYIPGLGTPFPEIGELDFSPQGMVSASRGEDRINWGLLWMVDALLFVTSQKARLNNSVALANLSAMATQWPYTMWGKSRRRKAIASLLEPLRTQMSRTLPKVLAIKLYVYGFSRGAAEARTFINWLSELFDTPEGAEHPQQSLLGVPLSIDFLGLMDTVASVGAPYVVPFADGHMDWADGTQQLPDEQRFPGWIKDCRHFVAAHEQRLSFPMESIRRADGQYPSYAKEVIYPGMHSDVGGGYPQGDQGKARIGQGELLSQIALHDMYAAAFARGAPLTVPRSAIPTSLLQIPPNREMSAAMAGEFDASPALITRFNAWRSTFGLNETDRHLAEPLRLGRSLEETLAEQMALITGWRIDRYARSSYARQPFYAAARQTPEPEQKKLKDAREQAIARILHARQAAQTVPYGNDLMPGMPGLPGYEPVIDQQQLSEAAKEFEHDYQGWRRKETSFPGALLDGKARSIIYLLNDDDERLEYQRMKAAGEEQASLLFERQGKNNPNYNVSRSPHYAAVVALFDEHVHDSRAVFLHHLLGSREMWNDYFRYRTVFFGAHSNKRLTAVIVGGRVSGVALAPASHYRIHIQQWLPAQGQRAMPMTGYWVLDARTGQAVPFLPGAIEALQPTTAIGKQVEEQQRALLLAEEAQRSQELFAHLQSVKAESAAPEQTPS